MMRRLLMLLAVMFLMPWMTAVQANIIPPDTLVRDTSERVIERLRAEREHVEKDSQRLYHLVDELILPHFDFVRMSKWVLGKNWRTATVEQRDLFVKEFRILLVRTYSKALIENLDRKIIYQPLRAAPGAEDVTVYTEVPQDGSFPIAITYSMYLTEGEWKVYDVNIDGISLVANYRTTFANEIKQKGLDVLIKTLRERNIQATNE